jgi:hypothetical protein
MIVQDTLSSASSAMRRTRWRRRSRRAIRDWRPDNASRRPVPYGGLQGRCRPARHGPGRGEGGGREDACDRCRQPGRRHFAGVEEGAGAALEEGFDLASGLHNLLRDEEDLAAVAGRRGGRLHDVRVPEVKYPIANGVPRSGKRCLAVGTDCSVGKMYTSLAMDLEMKARVEIVVPRHRADGHPDHRQWACRSMRWWRISWPDRSSG